MKSKKLNPMKFLGIITAVCAIGIMILNYFTNGDIDSYILPFILINFAVAVYLNKQKKETKPIEFNKTTRIIILSIASITFVSGVVAMIFTVL